jgi:signal transduction histidine kinase
MREQSEKSVSWKITKLYLLALTAIALLSLGGQILVQFSLKKQLSDSRIINIAGRQRMLSQKICKTSLLLVTTSDGIDHKTHIDDLKEALELWVKYHNGLKDAHLDHINSSFTNSPTILSLFENIEPQFNTMYNSALEIQSEIIKKHANNIKTRQSLRELLSNEREYLKKMDKIVLQYQVEATEKVNRSRFNELILFVCTLLILVLEAGFVFKPAVRQIKLTIEKLIDSEKNTLLINEELKVTNKELKETREALLEATNQRHLKEISRQKIRSAYLVEGQEEERKRIAREIHDGLGQMLTALKFGIERVSNSPNLSYDDQKNLMDLQFMVSDTISEVRTISFNLMPTVLSDFGIASALKLLTSQVAKHSGVAIGFHSNLSADRLPKNVEVGLYRISQEAIHNAVKYAKAKEINVELIRKKRNIFLKISDNGSGFSFNEIASPTEAKGPGNGISNMKERAFLINGDIKIITDPGRGTEIHLKTSMQELEYEKD